MVRLPVSGIGVALRTPDGADEMALAEAGGEPVAAGIGLLDRIARTDEGALDSAALTVTDFETLLLRMREQRFGPQLALGFGCPDCGARVEVSFRTDEYLSAVRPRDAVGVTADGQRRGWYCLDGAGFRLPTAGDQADVAGERAPGAALARKCLDAAARRVPAKARVIRAIAAMAPEVSRPIAGTCPACSASVRAPLHVARVVVAELRRSAASVYDDVDLIARAYHWPEDAILAMPQQRRRAYAERLRDASGVTAA